MSADRFGVPDLLPFTISDMGFRHRALHPLDAVSRRLAHGVFGCNRWQNRGVSPGRLPTRYASPLSAAIIDPRVVLRAVGYLYGGGKPSPVVAKRRQRPSSILPPTMRSYNTITANRRQITPVPLALTNNQWHLRYGAPAVTLWQSRRIPCCCSAARTTQRESPAPRGAPDHGGAIAKKHGVQGD